jgi:hypothetical protein
MTPKVGGSNVGYSLEERSKVANGPPITNTFWTMPNLKMHCEGHTLRLTQCRTIEDGNLRISVLTTCIVDERIDSVWWQ